MRNFIMVILLTTMLFSCANSHMLNNEITNEEVKTEIGVESVSYITEPFFIKDFTTMEPDGHGGEELKFWKMFCEIDQTTQSSLFDTASNYHNQTLWLGELKIFKISHEDWAIFGENSIRYWINNSFYTLELYFPWLDQANPSSDIKIGTTSGIFGGDTINFAIETNFSTVPESFRSHPSSMYLVLESNWPQDQVEVPIDDTIFRMPAWSNFIKIADQEVEFNMVVSSEPVSNNDIVCNNKAYITLTNEIYSAPHIKYKYNVNGQTFISSEKENVEVTLTDYDSQITVSRLVYQPIYNSPINEHKSTKNLIYIEAPEIIVPTNNQQITTSNEFDIMNCKGVKFEWTPRDYANFYKLYVNGQMLYSGPDTSFISDVFENGTYEISVRAHNSLTGLEAYSDTESFTIDVPLEVIFTASDSNGSGIVFGQVEYFSGSPQYFGFNLYKPDTPSRMVLRANDIKRVVFHSLYGGGSSSTVHTLYIGHQKLVSFNGTNKPYNPVDYSQLYATNTNGEGNIHLIYEFNDGTTETHAYNLYTLVNQSSKYNFTHNKPIKLIRAYFTYGGGSSTTKHVLYFRGKWFTWRGTTPSNINHPIYDDVIYWDQSYGQ